MNEASTQSIPSGGSGSISMPRMSDKLQRLTLAYKLCNDSVILRDRDIMRDYIYHAIFNAGLIMYYAAFTKGDIDWLIKLFGNHLRINIVFMGFAGDHPSSESILKKLKKTFEDFKKFRNNLAHDERRGNDRLFGDTLIEVPLGYGGIGYNERLRIEYLSLSKHDMKTFLRLVESTWHIWRWKECYPVPMKTLEGRDVSVLPDFASNAFCGSVPTIWIRNENLD